MRRITIALALIAVGLGGASAAEGDVTVVGGLDFGFKKLHLDNGTNGNVFNPSFTTINPTVALGYKSFYSVLSYDRSIGSDAQTGEIGTTTATVTTYSRRDSSATLGYRLNGSFNVFLGYTDGVNEFRQSTAALVLVVTDVKYSEKGPFAGASYTAAFRDKGTLGLSIAYAKLDSEFKTVRHPDSVTSDVTGDNKGLSYGLTWSGTMTGSLGYRLGVKETRYEMKEPGQIKERYTSFFIGMTNYF
jgi:hypothetical protein